MGPRGVCRRAFRRTQQLSPPLPEPHVGSNRPCGMCSWRRQWDPGPGFEGVVPGQALLAAGSCDSGGRSTRASPPRGQKRLPNTVLAWGGTKGTSYPSAPFARSRSDRRRASGFPRSGARMTDAGQPREGRGTEKEPGSLGVLRSAALEVVVLIPDRAPISHPPEGRKLDGQPEEDHRDGDCYQL